MQPEIIGALNLAARYERRMIWSGKYNVKLRRKVQIHRHRAASMQLVVDKARYGSYLEVK